MIRLFAASRLVLLVSRKSDENCNLDEVAPLVALRDATSFIAEVTPPMLIPEIVTAPVAFARLTVELTLSAPDKLSELMLMVGPESPRVEITTCLDTDELENRTQRIECLAFEGIQLFLQFFELACIGSLVR